ncbi:MAG TPA: alpha/beta fold hydrolase, partial [Candidatus Nanopelagicales bacterium]|nr:alpha/beta fold hydrolase [Candidatus Nanopelagicales bacterium]
ENGEELDALLEQIVVSAAVPVEELLLIGHSMGGLLIRSATHAASMRGDRRWLPLVRRSFYLGTPHLGAPLERIGNALAWALRGIGDPVTVLLADVVNLRSSGVKDLRYGYLRREDWDGADPDALLENGRHPAPLLPHIRHYLIAASLSDDPRMQLLFGDAMVPVPSACGRAERRDRCPPLPQDHVRVMPGMGHMRLTHDPEVYAQIRAWCEMDGEGTESECNAGVG